MSSLRFELKKRLPVLFAAALVIAVEIAGYTALSETRSMLYASAETGPGAAKPQSAARR
jgi:hypothetical protein